MSKAETKLDYLIDQVDALKRDGLFTTIRSLGESARRLARNRRPAGTQFSVRITISDWQPTPR